MAAIVGDGLEGVSDMPAAEEEGAEAAGEGGGKAAGMDTAHGAAAAGEPGAAGTDEIEPGAAGSDPSSSSVPSSAAAPAAGETSEKAKVDLVFVLDATGSMASYINSARKSINDIAAKLKAEEISARFALVAYRDHPPQERSFITRVTDFTPLPFLIKSKLDKLSASGGGDPPEAIATALFDAMNLKWRDQASKVIVLIADAPPHGLENNGNDGFVCGDPLTADRKKKIPSDWDKSKKFLNIMDIVRSFRDDLLATVYTVACEPSVSLNFDFCRDFFMFVAECTDGKFLPLSSADLLPKVIIGSVKQQIAMDKLEKQLDIEMQIIKQEFISKEGREPSDEELDDLLTQKFTESGFELDEISLDKLYLNDPPRDNVDLLLNDQICDSLSTFKKQAKVFPRLTRADLAFLPPDPSERTRTASRPIPTTSGGSSAKPVYYPGPLRGEGASGTAGLHDIPPFVHPSSVIDRRIAGGIGLVEKKKKGSVKGTKKKRRRKKKSVKSSSSYVRRKKSSELEEEDELSSVTDSEDEGEDDIDERVSKDEIDFKEDYHGVSPAVARSFGVTYSSAPPTRSETAPIGASTLAPMRMQTMSMKKSGVSRSHISKARMRSSRRSAR